MNKNITLIILLVFALTFSISASNLEIHFIDVGQGDSILIKTPSDENILVDGGGRANAIKAKIINYLKKEKVIKIDYMISTHPHADHVGGLKDIIDEFEILNVLDSGKKYGSKTFENYLAKINQENINFKTPKQGDRIRLKDSEIIFLHPDEDIDSESINNSSIVFVYRYGKQIFLFTGDIEREIKKEILKENPNLKVDLIKVPHHGSGYSSYPDWVESVAAKIAVIQVGENHYGHPSKEIIELYSKYGKVYRNDLNGDIVVTANKSEYIVTVNESQDKFKLLIISKTVFKGMINNAKPQW